MNTDEIKNFFNKYSRIYYAASVLETYIVCGAKIDLDGHDIYTQHNLLVRKTKESSPYDFNLIYTDHIIEIEEMTPTEIILYKLENNL